MIRSITIFELTLVVLCMIGYISHAGPQQQVSISGKVISEDDNQPLPGVSIIVKGTTTGTVSDVHGNYTIAVEKGNVLSFSFIGMQQQDITLGDQSVLNVFMVPEVMNLNEVVITALGMKREKKSIGYSVSEVEGSQLSKALEINPLTALSGKVAGVDISLPSAGPSGSPRVVIRGNSKLDTDNQPLYVIDGVPMENGQMTEGAGKWGGYDLGNGVANLNANDIESVTVLKGASASALYGSRASNGVILITTKSGKTQKGIGVEFTSNCTVEKVLSMFDDYQTVYGQGLNGQIPTIDNVLTSQVAWGAKLDPTILAPIYNGEMKPYSLINNNILSFFRTGSTLTNTVAVSGGNEKATIRASVSDLRNKDIVPNSGLNRNTFLINATTKLGKKISISSKANYIIEDVKNRPALSDNAANVGNSIIGIAPNFDQRWLSKNYKDQYGNYIDWNANIYRLNPYWTVNEMSNTSTKKRIMGFLQANYKFKDWLDLQVRGGTDFSTFRYTNYIPRGTPAMETGKIEEYTRTSSENNYEAILKMDREVTNDLSVVAFIGGNIRYNKAETLRQIGDNQTLTDVKKINAYSNKMIYYDPYEKQVNSVFGSVSLGYKETYYLDASIRNDWSSTLDKGNNSYLYPSISASYIFSNHIGEKSFLTFGKLRASWAEVGGDTQPYRLHLNYGLKGFSLLGHPLGEISNSSIPNANLLPTRTSSYEVGAELNVFNDRLRLDASYYRASTRDQILSLNLPRSTGYNSAIVNSGEITNRGVELALSGKAISRSNVNWTVTVTFARNINKVEKLHDQIKSYVLAEARWAGATIMAKEGEAFGVIVGKKILRDTEGNIIHNSAGMPLFDTKQEVLGNGVYLWTSGLNNFVSYKNINLSFLVDVKYGADVYSMGNANAYAGGTAKETLAGRDEWYASEEQRLAQNIEPAKWIPTGGYIGKGVINKGSVDNPEYVENTVPVNPQNYWSTFKNGTPEPFIYDATYAKLREVIIGYSLNKNMLSKTPFEGASISFVARNLWILYSKIPNIDPESNYNNGNGQGLEYGSIPSRKSYGVTINLKF
jgi:TonB-linked SusC/RagA family outer membrane protein